MEHFIGCLAETSNYSILSLALITSSFRKNEEKIVFETEESGQYPFFNVFPALEGTHFYILFGVTAAGVVLFGSHKKQPRSSSIVQFIFFVWSFEISGNIQRNQKILIYVLIHMFQEGFLIWTIFGLISVFILAALWKLKLQYPFSGFNCQFIQGQ